MKRGEVCLSYLCKCFVFVFFLFGVVLFVKPVSALFYNFNADGTLWESSSMSESSSPYWWLNSGAYLRIYDGRGHTNLGNLPTNDVWRKIYSRENPEDTDNGYHPQNIFRLVTKSKWQNTRQQVYFDVLKDNLSPSPNRAEHNGLLLMSRYVDGDNLYYTGVRVDGAAVIKKKKNGEYFTLAYVPGIYPGIYDRDTKPSLLPKFRWIGIRSELRNNPDGSVNIKLYIDKGWTGVWTLIAEVNDTQNPITQTGYGGVRTDFMDVIIDDYRADNL